MTIPTINVVINFGSGASFAQAMVLDTGLLDYNILADAAAQIVDVSNVVQQILITRGRNALADQFQTGALSMTIADQTNAFNPTNTLSPYYPNVLPLRKVSITATYAGVVYPLFAGYITAYSTVTPQNAAPNVTYTTITAVDGFRLLQNAQIANVAGSSAGDLSGTRVSQILDAIAWPQGMRNISAGATTVQADTGLARTSLAAIQNIETTEYGAFFADASGNLVFKDRNAVLTSLAKTPVVYNDTGTAIGYTNAVWILNDVLVYNSAQITATGLAVQSASDAASIAKYFLHSYNQQGLSMQTTTDALNYAQAYIASRAETVIRCDNLSLDLYTANYNLGIIAALSLNYFDPITITTTQPNSSSITKTEQVFGVSHSITPSSWKVNLVTLENIIDGLLLDSAITGLLDTNVLAY